jgi:nucleotide-binding universal stress UspA family protein
MLPQAGVAVGLGLAAAQTFPEAGATVNAVVLAAIVFFEVVGPVLTKRAIACTLEPEPAEARETDAACASRTILMPVSAALPPERLLNTIEATGCGAGCRPTIVLAHIMPLERARRSTNALSAAEAHLAVLAESVVAEGYTVETTVRAARTLDRGVATLAAEYDADLVAMGAPLRGPRTGPGLSPLRSTQHRVLDALDIPVLIVPMPGAHEGDAQ